MSQSSATSFEQRYTKLEISYILIGIFLSLLMFKTLVVHTDNTQLTDKVVKILTLGEWSHHGNAATKMGTLPGSFLTVVTAVPMMVWNSPYAACLVILVFHLLSYFILRRLAFKYFENFQPLYLAIFFWLNPWRVEQSELYNPGYLFLFSALYFYFISKMSERKNFWDSLFLAVTVGFCFQVHFSVLILGISFLFLYFKKKIQVHYLGFSVGCGLIGLSLLPWLSEQLHGQTQSLQTHSGAYLGRNLVLVYPVIKAIIYFFRMGSVYCGRHIFSEINFNYIDQEFIKGILQCAFHLLKWIVAAVTLFLSFRFFGVKFLNYKKNWTLKKTSIFVDDFLVSIMVGVIGAAALSPVEFNHWHFILCFPVVALLMAGQLPVYFGYRDFWAKYQNQIIRFFAVLFIIWGLLMSFGSRSHSLFNDYHQAYFELYQSQLK